MPIELEKELNKACPTCGMVNVWICSARDCPKAGDQKAARDRWQEMGRNPEGEESST